MKLRSLTLGLSALALISTTAANAQVERFGYTVGGGPGVLSYPAVVGGTAGGCGAQIGYGGCDVPLFGSHTFYDNGLDYSGRGPGLLGGLLGGILGGGLLGFGGPGYGPGYGAGYGWGGGYGPYGAGMGVSTLSAVVPGGCGAAAGIAPTCGQRLGNSVFDLKLFGFGLGFGRVNPRWDMRPAGTAI